VSYWFALHPNVWSQTERGEFGLHESELDIFHI